MTLLDPHIAIVNDFLWNIKSPKEFILRDRNLNDRGYYTTYILYKKVVEDDNVPLFELKIFNPNQEKGIKTDFSSPFVSFISSVEWAKTLMNYFSKERIQFLTNLLNIKFSYIDFYSMGVFKDSICRGFNNVHHWQAEQNAIKKILI